MIVFYRMTPKESQHEDKRPIYPHNKFALVEFCLKSFVKGFADIKPDVKFILDSCDYGFVEMIKRECPFKYEVIHIQSAQDKSYLYQLEMARDCESEIIYFQEDDYFYLPNVGKTIQLAIQELGFVNPYDHKEFYTLPEYHPNGNYSIKLVDNHHFRTCRFNTMTYGTTKTLLNECWGSFKAHGYWDLPTWDEVKKINHYELWSPIPGLATHMHSEFLSPGINWERKFHVGK